jgi:multidrug efflux system outer membrane protein
MTPRSRPRRGRHLVAALAALLAASACTLGPDYARPPVAVPLAWRDPVQDSVAPDTAWWLSYGDPVLAQLVAEALRENRDIRIAATRVDEYLGRYGQTRAAQFPTVGVQGDSTLAGRQRSSRITSGIPDGVSAESAMYLAAVSASWELDLWGRLRRGTEAARADLLATEEARRGVVLSLVGQVVAGYLDLRTLDRRLAVARDTLVSRTESLRIFDLRFRGGVISELELSQSRSEYAQTLSSIPTLEAQIAQRENALCLLLGRNPGPIPRGRALDELAVPPIPAGLPSDLLLRRPDLRQAEQALVAANARIGAAQALYFPRITLTGLFGGASTELGDLFTGPARTWSYAATLAVPIFNAGAISGQVAQANAQQQGALLSYQQAIQSAFADVDSALTTSFKAREEVSALAQQVDALRRYARLARLRYDNGYTSYIEVLDSERSLFTAELNYASSQGAALSAVVDVYKAMGGGWIDVADRGTPIGNAAPVAERARQQPLF